MKDYDPSAESSTIYMDWQCNRSCLYMVSKKKKKKCHAHRNTKAGLGLQTDTRKIP